MEEQKQPVTESEDVLTTSSDDKGMITKTKNSPVLITTVVVLAVALVAVIGVLVYLSRKPAETVADHNGSSAIIVTEDTRDSTQQMTDRVAAGMIAVKMTPVWIFPDGASAGNGYVANSKANDKPLQITVSLADTGEELLNAGPIPVGSCIENFKLDKELEKGTYSVIVTYTQLDEDGEKYNSVQTEISIEIKN